MYTDRVPNSATLECMTELEKGPRGLRRGEGARERILGASRRLFRDQGINSTGLDQLCAVAQVSKRTFYQHFTGKDELIAEHLRRFDPDVLPEVFDRTDLTPRERLLAVFDIHATAVPVHRGGRRTPRPEPPGTRTRPRLQDEPLPRGSPRPRARPAPPTPNSSANNWRCSWMAPRPATGSSTPKPSPPPPPSQPSSSTTPSPRQRQRPAQAGTDPLPSSSPSSPSPPLPPPPPPPLPPPPLLMRLSCHSPSVRSSRAACRLHPQGCVAARRRPAACGRRCSPRRSCRPRRAGRRRSR